MDFGVMGLEGFVSSETTTTGFGSDPDTNQNLYGSGLFKQERCHNNEDEFRSSKLAKNDEFSGFKPLMFQQRNTLMRSNNNNNNCIFFDEQEEQQMLSFSATKSDALSVDRRSSKNMTFPYFHLPGYNNGGFNVPFTPCQWMELEYQALIYKYIIADVSIPSNLLIPIRKSLDSANFSSFSAGLLRPNTSQGWEGFKLGFSNNTDPEPGRCRRTDGKKWRCSRDAVADQKYCERHMNRGRHRSRKPVEGKSGHSVAAATTTKLMPNVSSSSASIVGLVGSGKPNSLSAATPPNMLTVKKDIVGEKMPYTAPELSMISSNGSLKSKENPFLIPKQQISYEDNSRNGLGVVSSDLLNHYYKGSSMIKCADFGSSTSQETESQHPFRRFIDDQPKSQSDRSSIFWPEFDVQSYKTQLSILIPTAASDFMSTTSSPNNEYLTLSPLRLSREFDPTHIGLGMGNVINESDQKQVNWTPISWETSMGGPLGEALHSSNTCTLADFKNSSVLNLLTEGSDNNPRFGSSPTGVLQKTTFGSLSNSSAGSSPTIENNNQTH